jgi:hypothetical protein
MKPLNRRSVTTGLAAAVTAIPALGLAVAARSDRLERIKRLTREPEKPLLDCHPGAKIMTMTNYVEPDGEVIEGMNPYVMIVAQVPGVPS